jgi:hypothetical protein
MPTNTTEKLPLSKALMQEEGQLGLHRSWATFRIWVAWAIVVLFVVTNVFVIVLVSCLALQDYHQILVNPAYGNRVINTTVILSLISASVLELGALTLGLGKHLFPPG